MDSGRFSTPRLIGFTFWTSLRAVVFVTARRIDFGLRDFGWRLEMVAARIFSFFIFCDNNLWWWRQLAAAAEMKTRF